MAGLHSTFCFRLMHYTVKQEHTTLNWTYFERWTERFCYRSFCTVVDFSITDPVVVDSIQYR